MNFDIQHPNFLYALFFFLAHIISWCILFRYGRRRNYPLTQWLLIIVTGYTFFTIGSNVLAVNAESVKMLLTGAGWPNSMGKSLIGGLLLAIPAMLLVKNLLKFSHAIFEPYAITIPLGIAIQRIGCLAAGCCYGNPTTLPWGISYDFGHFIHYTQWQQGLIASSELPSMAIHPVQIYEGMLCLCILALILYLHKRKRMQNQLIYVFLFLYSIVRFITEIFRAEAAHTLGLNNYFSLNTVQWIMIVSSLIFLYTLMKGQQINQAKKVTCSEGNNFTLKGVVWFIALIALIQITSKLYSRIEVLLLGILLIPTSAFVFWNVFKSMTVPKLRFATVSMCVIAIFLMSQQSADVEGETTLKNYHEISIGGYIGSNSMTHYTTSCNGTKTNDAHFDENYYLMGVGYKYVKALSEDKRLTMGLGASFGQLNDQVDVFQGGIDITNHVTSYSVSPFVQYDIKRWGLGVGILAGEINVFREPNMYSGSLEMTKKFNILPQFHFRVGNLNKVWGEFNYGHRFPGVSPANEFDLLLGIRGEKGNLVRFGTSAYHAVVVRPEFYINKIFGIEPYFGFGGPLFSSSFTKRNGIEAGLNLHYQISH